jgi:hypothetical protein
MPTSSYRLKALHVVSPLVAAYVEATNTGDLEGLVDLFADDALVNDQLRIRRYMSATTSLIPAQPTGRANRPRL